MFWGKEGRARLEQPPPEGTMPLVSLLLRDEPRLQACLVADSAHVVPGATGRHVGLIQKVLLVLEANDDWAHKGCDRLSGCNTPRNKKVSRPVNPTASEFGPATGLRDWGGPVIRVPHARRTHRASSSARLRMPKCRNTTLQY